MKKRKISNTLITISGLVLLSVSALYCFKLIYSHYKIDKETEQVIEELFTIDEDTTSLEVEEETPVESPKEDNFVLTDKYLGYIELSNYGIRRLITTGTDKATLDKGLVGTLSVSAGIDDEVGNLIIAGHSTYNTFQKLHYMKIGEEIKIVSHQNTYIYKITEKHTIEDTDMSYFRRITNKKLLTLITCKNNGKQRLIVVAELRG